MARLERARCRDQVWLAVGVEVFGSHLVDHAFILPDEIIASHA